VIAVVLGRGGVWNPEVPFAEQAGFAAHVILITGLLSSGIAIEAGPFSDPAVLMDDDLLALALLDLESVEEAKDVFARDPIVADGVVSLHVHPWGGQPLQREDE
jgi:YCII-related domain